MPILPLNMISPMVSPSRGTGLHGFWVQHARIMLKVVTNALA